MLNNTTAKYAQMLDDKKLTEDEVNKYGYYKFSHTTRQKKQLNTIRDNEFDVGYSGVVNAHR